MKKLIALLVATLAVSACGPSAEVAALRDEVAQLRAGQQQRPRTSGSSASDPGERAVTAARVVSNELTGVSDAQLRAVGVQRIPAPQPATTQANRPNAPATSGGEARAPRPQQNARFAGSPLQAMRRQGVIPAVPTGVTDDTMFLNPPWSREQGQTRAIDAHIVDGAYSIEIWADGRRICAYGNGFPSPQTLGETTTGGITQNCAVPPTSDSTYSMWMRNLGTHQMQACFYAYDPFTGVSTSARSQTANIETGGTFTVSSFYANGGPCR